MRSFIALMLWMRYKVPWFGPFSVILSLQNWMRACKAMIAFRSYVVGRFYPCFFSFYRLCEDVSCISFIIYLVIFNMLLHLTFQFFCFHNQIYNWEINGHLFIFETVEMSFVATKVAHHNCNCIWIEISSKCE